MKYDHLFGACYYLKYSSAGGFLIALVIFSNISPVAVI